MNLDETIAQELKKLYQELESERKLLSQEQLENYYNTFRSRFGPERLKNLDGEALLETMHSHGTKDSLVYWLEFKDDDEFPSSQFGSIAGGSAYKFGLFWRRETGKWVTGSPQHERELTLEQAVEKARQHRDQLLKGVELLEKLPANGSDNDYAKLQLEMNNVAPDVNNSAWGHKYFHLIHPDKLDDFHNPDYQRFHLIRLLQLPPEGDGRYLVAGRFVALARTLDIPMNNLTSMLNVRDGSPPYTYWRIGTRAGADGTSYWEMMRDNNCVAIGWLEAGDLSAITYNPAGREEIKQKLLSHDPAPTPIAAANAARQLFNFRWVIAPGDLVLASDSAIVLGIGRVTGDYGDYHYDPSHHLPHRRSVEWLSLESWKQPDLEGMLTTVHRMRKDKNLLEAEQKIFSPVVPPPPPPPPPPPLKCVPARIQAVLERKGQVILYGPPGTGKTYWAEITARELAARANFGASFDQLNAGQKASLLGTDTHSSGTVRMCSFHPAYGYEDFLEGFRPESVNGQMYFTLRDGIFKRLCGDAQANPDKKFYLIIDEINRGDIPRIFGELLTVLEKNKRGKAILLPLTGEPFRVPENVYIIGTMNTADRSIALLDTALRRRFGFIELMPDISTLGDAAVGGIPLGLWLQALNERICEYVGRDARNLQIGHSYFLLENGQPVQDFATFAQIIQEDILPLLEEYCYEDFTKLENILGSTLVDTKKQQFHYGLFDPANRDQLIQALLEPSREITTTKQAADAEAKADELLENDEDEISDLGSEQEA